MASAFGVPSTSIHSPAADNEQAAGLLDDRGLPRNWPLEVLRGLPAAVFIADAGGRVAFYNKAAARLSCARPRLGESDVWDTWKLLRPDGRLMPRSESPAAITLREQRPVDGVEVIVERFGGSHGHFIHYSHPLFDEAGDLCGAVNTLVDITGRQRTEELAIAAQKFAAIVESSDDAIMAVDLNGAVMSWNKGAERLYGYSGEEIIGQPVTILLPQDRQDEEPSILGRIKRGERLDHYETVRRRKDGTLVDISLTVSPVKNPEGRIVGASKIARDITERRRAMEQQKLLLREMDHRIKNLFTLAGSLVALSARSAESPEALAIAVQRRLEALAQAHSLTLRKAAPGSISQQGLTTLHNLIRTIAAPFEEHAGEQKTRVVISGPDAKVSAAAITAFALLFHELTANAAKYGALSAPEGSVHIQFSDEADALLLTWSERGGPAVSEPEGREGFGWKLAHLAVERQLGGTISYDWQPEGLIIRLSVAKERLRD